jgi:hypothetical protein
MGIDWQTTAIALASRLQFEAACGRGRLISEDLSRIFLVEILQSQTSGFVEPEYNHPDLPGDTRVDLLIRSPNAQNIEAAIEHKWVRETTQNTIRHWMAEVLGDVMRVEALSQEMVQGSQRIVCVSGEVEEMRRAIWESKSNNGNGQQRIGVVDNLLQSSPQLSFSPQDPITVQLERTGPSFYSKLKQGSKELFARLPARYSVELVGYHRAHSHGVECAIWRIGRPVGQRVTFDANKWQR